MHPALLRVRDHLIGTSFEGRVWLVGGAVRDELLGREVPGDFDLVTTEDALALARRLFEQGLAEGPPAVYPRFGTAMVRVGGTTIELATARRESYAHESRKPETVEPASLEEDARRRDFTVNTLMRSLQTGELHDPLGMGQADLEAKILRTPQDPVATFRDDPLRMLRAVRFAHRLGFGYAPGLREAIQAMAPRLEIVSAERIRDEFVKMLVHESAAEALEDLRSLELLPFIIPELMEMPGVDQGKWHHLDVWDHTRLVVSKVSGTPTLRLAALLHDVAKPRTRTVDAEGNVRFFGHENIGAEMTVRILDRLKLSNEEIGAVALLVKNHMRLGTAPTFSPSAARRLLRDLSPHVEELLDLVEADAASLRPGVRTLDLEPIRSQLARAAEATPVEVLQSPLDGEAIMALTGWPAGPRVGEAKRYLTELVLEGEIAPGDQAAARQRLQSWLAMG